MRSFFTHNTMDMHLLNDEYVIENDIDDSKFSADAHPLFNGGGYCTKCFKEYMDSIGFDLNSLRAPAGLTF